MTEKLFKPNAMRTHFMSRKISAFYINYLFSIVLFLSLFLSFNALCRPKKAIQILIEQK